eukprot:gene17480-23032_t
MHIKQVIISGFRSFRNQNEIDPFSPKHNVIVGRNGSGKSNFFDVIQFVLLSPKFANLRQEDRQQLLHEGAGSSVMAAYAEIIFDNSDGRFPVESDEVVLRRTVGHKKDEFFLNRKRIQKSEVISLLESAGFSKSNPYYIVQQGKVANLCVMKDKDRLELLKEVAGTTVYEERRSESIKITEDTIKKQEQIDEVLKFIEDRLSELDQEKDELKDYEQLDKSRRCLEYHIYDMELEKATTQLKDIESSRDDERDHQQQLYAELHKSKQQLSSSLPRHISQGLATVELLAQQLNITGYYGPLIDNFELKNEVFRTAVEVAADKRKAGRLTFLPLNQLKRNKYTVSYPDSNDVRPLIDVALNYDEEFEIAIKHVFSTKLLARDLEVASHFSKEYNLDAITKDGDSVNRKGGFEGGYRDDRDSKIYAVLKIREFSQRLNELELITTLDNQKEEAILRTFRGVSHHFSEVFKELVPSGVGKLVMRTTDDDTIEEEELPTFETKSSFSRFHGVQVIVQFTTPGQQFEMQQLSGGQKAIVALALIFSIQRCDPAPFYLFDEIDQALDANYRSNVARLISKQANSPDAPAQFITTTFRPELVAVADKCYGIALQNKVSNIFPLEKDEAQSFVENIINDEAIGQISSIPNYLKPMASQVEKSPIGEIVDEAEDVEENLSDNEEELFEEEFEEAESALKELSVEVDKPKSKKKESTKRSAAGTRKLK